MKTYEEFDYAITRLIDTVVLRKGKAFLIERMDDFEDLVYGLSFNPTEQVVCNLDDLDITPVQLGYVNWGETATYVVRAPMREDWRQGLRYNSARMADGRRVDHISMSCIAYTIEGCFPSLTKCIEDLGGGYMMRAFSRSFAVDSEQIIYYKETPVGKLDKATLTITLNDKFNWLNETLEEEMQNAN